MKTTSELIDVINLLSDHIVLVQFKIDRGAFFDKNVGYDEIAATKIKLDTLKWVLLDSEN